VPVSASLMNLRNPKQDNSVRRGRSGWYQYYAGFSANFVLDALSAAEAEPGVNLVLDPWNGGGTTTEVAAQQGFDAYGFDLNPVMIIVAKARTLRPDIRMSLVSLWEDILLRAETVDVTFKNEPLLTWLGEDTAASIRRMEIAIQTVLIDAKSYQPLGTALSLSHVSSLAAFFYVALFKMLRTAVKSFRSSNPTWIKSAVTLDERINIPRITLKKMARDLVKNMCQDLALETSQAARDTSPRTNINIEVASSCSLPMRKGSVDVVVTSPPYCTRIDYVVKTGPELALLGVGGSSVLRCLREGMIGTPTISDELPSRSPAWGKACSKLLNRVSRHSSRASKSYYLKTLIQYFDGMCKSLGEIDRVLARKGEAFFVIQDSYYKEIHMDLAKILTEMAANVGWRCDSRLDFESTRTMVGVNRGARLYNNPPKPALETVLHFAKLAT
jgi:SAM-dependent methyltransferase